jgi:hypothetical protein
MWKTPARLPFGRLPFRFPLGRFVALDRRRDRVGELQTVESGIDLYGELLASHLPFRPPIERPSSPGEFQRLCELIRPLPLNGSVVKQLKAVKTPLVEIEGAVHDSFDRGRVRDPTEPLLFRRARRP